MECLICFSDYCKSLEELKEEYFRIQRVIKENKSGKIIKLFEEKENHLELEEQTYVPNYLTEINDALANKEKDVLIENDILLVKASRGVAAEKVLACLCGDDRQ